MDEYKIVKIFGTITAISSLVIVAVGLDTNTWKVVCNGMLFTIGGVVGILRFYVMGVKETNKRIRKWKG